MRPRKEKHRDQLIAIFSQNIAVDDKRRGFWSTRPDAPVCNTYSDRLDYLERSDAVPWEEDIRRFRRGFGTDYDDLRTMIRLWRHYLAREEEM